MSQLEQDLKDAVAKHLPQQVGEELQKRLKQADADAVIAAERLKKIDELREQIAVKDKKIREQEELLSKHEEVTKREAAVVERERNAEIESLKVQLLSANNNTQFAKEVALGLVRNVEYRSNVLKTENTSVPVVQPGGYTEMKNQHNATAEENKTTAS